MKDELMSELALCLEISESTPKVVQLLVLDEPQGVLKRRWRPGEKFAVGKWSRRDEERAYKLVDNVVGTSRILLERDTTIRLTLPVFFPPDLSTLDSFGNTRVKDPAWLRRPICPLFGPANTEVLPSVGISADQFRQFGLCPCKLYNLDVILRFKSGDFPEWTIAAQDLAGLTAFTVVQGSLLASICEGMLLPLLVVNRIPVPLGQHVAQFCLLTNIEAELFVSVYPGQCDSRCRKYMPMRLDCYECPVFVGLDWCEDVSQFSGDNPLPGVNRVYGPEDQFQLVLRSADFHEQSPRVYRLSWLGDLFDLFGNMDCEKKFIGFVGVKARAQWQFKKRSVFWFAVSMFKVDSNEAFLDTAVRELTPPVVSTSGPADAANETGKGIVVPFGRQEQGQGGAIHNRSVAPPASSALTASPWPISTVPAHWHWPFPPPTFHWPLLPLQPSIAHLHHPSPPAPIWPTNLPIRAPVPYFVPPPCSCGYPSPALPAASMPFPAFPFAPPYPLFPLTCPQSSNSTSSTVQISSLDGPISSSSLQRSSTPASLEVSQHETVPLDKEIEVMGVFMARRVDNGDAVFLLWDKVGRSFYRKCYAQFRQEWTLGRWYWFKCSHVDNFLISVLAIWAIDQQTDTRVRDGICAQFCTSNRLTEYWHIKSHCDEHSFYMDGSWWPWLCKHCFPGLCEGGQEKIDPSEEVLEELRKDIRKQMCLSANSSDSDDDWTFRSEVINKGKETEPKQFEKVTLEMETPNEENIEAKEDEWGNAENEDIEAKEDEWGNAEKEDRECGDPEDWGRGEQEEDIEPQQDGNGQYEVSIGSEVTEERKTAIAVYMGDNDEGDEQFLVWDDEIKKFCWRAEASIKQNWFVKPRLGDWYEIEYCPLEQLEANYHLIKLHGHHSAGARAATRVHDKQCVQFFQSAQSFLYSWHKKRNCKSKFFFTEADWWPSICKECFPSVPGQYKKKRPNIQAIEPKRVSPAADVQINRQSQSNSTAAEEEENQHKLPPSAVGPSPIKMKGNGPGNNEHLVVMLAVRQDNSNSVFLAFDETSGKFTHLLYANSPDKLPTKPVIGQWFKAELAGILLDRQVNNIAGMTGTAAPTETRVAGDICAQFKTPDPITKFWHKPSKNHKIKSENLSGNDWWPIPCNTCYPGWDSRSIGEADDKADGNGKELVQLPTPAETHLPCQSLQSHSSTEDNNDQQKLPIIPSQVKVNSLKNNDYLVVLLAIRHDNSNSIFLAYDATFRSFTNLFYADPPEKLPIRPTIGQWFMAKLRGNMRLGELNDIGAMEGTVAPTETRLVEDICAQFNTPDKFTKIWHKKGIFHKNNFDMVGCSAAGWWPVPCNTCFPGWQSRRVRPADKSTAGAAEASPVPVPFPSPSDYPKNSLAKSGKSHQPAELGSSGLRRPLPVPVSNLFAGFNISPKSAEEGKKSSKSHSPAESTASGTGGKVNGGFGRSLTFKPYNPVSFVAEGPSSSCSTTLASSAGSCTSQSECSSTDCSLRTAEDLALECRLDRFAKWLPPPVGPERRISIPKDFGLIFTSDLALFIRYGAGHANVLAVERGGIRDIPANFCTDLINCLLTTKEPQRMLTIKFAEPHLWPDEAVLRKCKVISQINKKPLGPKIVYEANNLYSWEGSIKFELFFDPDCGGEEGKWITRFFM